MVRVQLMAAGMLGMGVLVVGDPAAIERRLEAGVAACTTIADPSRRMELADGRIVSIDVQSVARAGTSVLAVGRHVYVFPRTADSRTSPQMVDSILGVLLGASGRVTLVSNPAAPRPVLYSRTAVMPNGAFAVLYATTAPEGLQAHTDTASLWLATLRNGRWSRPARVAAVRTATLDRASALLERNGQLAFVYPFRDDRSHAEDGGAVLVRLRRGTWTFDTLRTETEPTSVSAAYDPVRGSVIAVLAVASRRPPLLAQRLHVARFDSTWSDPMAIAGDGITPIAHPSLIVSGSTLVSTWLTWPGHDARRGFLQWLQMDSTGRAHLRSVIDSGEKTFPYELSVANGAPLWLYHGEPFGSAVTLQLAQPSSIARLPDVKAEFWNPSTKTIALSGSRLLVFTQRRAQRETEPMVASFTTTLAIRCPGLAQR